MEPDKWYWHIDMCWRESQSDRWEKNIQAYSDLSDCDAGLSGGRSSRSADEFYCCLGKVQEKDEEENEGKEEENRIRQEEWELVFPEGRQETDRMDYI